MKTARSDANTNNCRKNDISKQPRCHSAVQQHSRLASAFFWFFFFSPPARISPPWETTWVGRWGVMNLSRQCHVGLDTGGFKYRSTVTVRVRQPLADSTCPQSATLAVCPSMHERCPQKDVLLLCIEKNGADDLHRIAMHIS